jgi:hypothetical protein
MILNPSQKITHSIEAKVLDAAWEAIKRGLSAGISGLFFRWVVHGESARNVPPFHFDLAIDSVLNPEIDSGTREESDAQG